MFVLGTDVVDRAKHARQQSLPLTFGSHARNTALATQHADIRFLEADFVEVVDHALQ